MTPHGGHGVPWGYPRATLRHDRTLSPHSLLREKLVGIHTWFESTTWHLQVLSCNTYYMLVYGNIQ